MSNTKVDTSASYIALVPRGLHHVFVERLRNEIEDCYSLTDVVLVGEHTGKKQEAYHDHLLDLLSKRKKQHSPNIGSVLDSSTNKHVSVGYRHDGTNNKQTVMSSYAGTSCPVWVQFTTNAPAEFANERLRFIGPLMACVQVWDNVNLNEKTTLDDVQELASSLDTDSTKLDNALQLWYAHVQDSWPLSNEELREIESKTKKTTPMTYRLSCVRAQSKHYSYTREQFIRVLADYVVPSTQNWEVDLSNYDVEVVLLVQPSCLAVGLALRPYRQLQTNSFSNGGIPPDVTTPHISGRALSGGLVRLRPTTAQLLWGLLSLNPGDVVLDPCAGIGTIPLELPAGVIGLGGDLVLAANDFASLATEYTKKMHEHNFSCKTNLVAWDAALLPLRTSCVDVVVSDLPFGQQCLSSTKLDTLLPLILGECGRVLRPGGTMLLLCGAFPAILDSLTALNALQTEGAMWNLPCEAVFPVNIGGLIAWIIKVRRGPAEAVHVVNHIERVRKLVSKRERHEKNILKEATKGGGLKYRKLQK